MIRNRIKRRQRVRAGINPNRHPRLVVFRSVKHIWAQIIGPDGKVLASAGEKEALSAADRKLTKSARASLVGKLIAAKAGKVKTVVFDRGSSRYHGRIKNLAEAARAGGLKF